MGIFAILTAFVLRKTEKLQGSVERYHSSLAEHASDALGNVPVIQSFTRVEAETRSLGLIIQQLLQAQNPVLSWWALASVASRASATITVTAIFLLGTWLHLNGLATIAGGGPKAELCAILVRDDLPCRNGDLPSALPIHPDPKLRVVPITSAWTWKQLGTL